MTSVIPTDDKRHCKHSEVEDILKSSNVRDHPDVASEGILATSLATNKLDYGVDAPAVMRNLFLSGALFLLFGIFAPSPLHIGPVSVASRTFLWPAGFLIAEGLLFLALSLTPQGQHCWATQSTSILRNGHRLLLAGAGALSISFHKKSAQHGSEGLQIGDDISDSSKVILCFHYRSPGHHVDGGSLAEIFVCRGATRWLRLYR